ncbi:hypothetical protein [Agromyces binzhouensis]|uniref:DUF2029 domain-containing protein n=1 Tax=Agromyces binzhouensis TaxID=1817495 RepID=A0A4Q2JUH9_9MICO|nr:hypothetical protein [Agromyces binzhouensis]RXZ50040.1 hypothetical protein ESO86_04015 [Agromyces binzhouensis]
MDAPSAARATGGVTARTRPRAARLPDWAWAIALVVLGSVVSWFRIEAAARATLWAEDGTFFLGDALDADPVSVLLKPYQGYLHLVPRIIAGVAVAVVPVEGYAIAMTVGSCLVVGAVSAVVFLCARSVVVWLPARIALGALTFLAPAAGWEVLGNTANLHWYLLWLAPWLLLAAPRRRSTAILLGVVGLVAALTEIQMLLFLPLLAWRFRDPNRWIVGAGVLIGSALQVAALLLSPRDAGAETSPPFLSTVQGYLYHAPMEAVFPSRQWKAAWVLHFGWWGAALVLLPFLVALAWVLWRGVAVERIAGAALAAGSIVAWSAAYVLNSNPDFFYSETPVALAIHLHLTRYGVVPSLYLLALVVLATSVAVRAGEWSRTAVGVLVGVMVLTVVAAIIPQPSARAGGPDWASQIPPARNSCAVDDAPDRTAIAIAPDGWLVEMPCDRLAR